MDSDQLIKNLKHVLEELNEYEVPDNSAVPDKKEWINFTLRIRKDLLGNIDEALEDRIGMTKTTWIMEAIQEKLKRKN